MGVWWAEAEAGLRLRWAAGVGWQRVREKMREQKRGCADAVVVVWCVGMKAMMMD